MVGTTLDELSRTQKWVLSSITRYNFFEHEILSDLRTWHALRDRIQRRGFEVTKGRTTETCALCLEEYGTEGATQCVFMQCGHHFCADCLLEGFWKMSASQTNRCALCRQPMVSHVASVTADALLQFTDTFHARDWWYGLPRENGRWWWRWYLKYQGREPLEPRTCRGAVGGHRGVTHTGGGAYGYVVVT